jgi:hypothetical protein
MKRLSNLLSKLVALLLLSVLVVGVYFAIRLVADLFIGLEEQVRAIILATLVSILIGTLNIALVMRWVQKWTSMDWMCLQRAKVYKRLIEAWPGVLSLSATADMQNALHMEDDLRKAEQQLILWGSRRVVKHYTIYRKQAMQNNTNDPIILSLVEKVLVEIRKDLRQNNLGIHAGDLLNLLLDDSHNTRGSNNTTRYTARGGQHLFEEVDYRRAE